MCFCSTRPRASRSPHARWRCVRWRASPTMRRTGSPCGPCAGVIRYGRTLALLGLARFGHTDHGLTFHALLDLPLKLTPGAYSFRLPTICPTGCADRPCGGWSTSLRRETQTPTTNRCGRFVFLSSLQVTPHPLSTHTPQPYKPLPGRPRRAPRDAKMRRCEGA